MADLDSLSCSVMFLANAAAVSTINVTKPYTYQPNIKVIQVPQVPNLVQWIFSVDWICCFISYSPDFANE